jgi:DNA repair protein RadC
MRYTIGKPHDKRIKEMEVHNRPRERMAERGAEALNDQELLAILIGSGNKERSVTTIAREVMELLDQRNRITQEELITISGLGPAKATLIIAALELGRRRLPAKRRQIRTPSDVYPLIRHYASRMQEHLLAISLNGAQEVLSINVCSIGLVNRTIVHPREVFSEALAQRASAIIVAHNHPSGVLEPSMEDREVTRRLKKAGDILGIPIIDHLIFSEDGFISMLEGSMF